MKDDFLNKTEMGDQMDDLFREGLKGFCAEPSPSVWKGLNRKLLWSEIRNFNFTNLSRMAWVGGVVMLGLVFTIGYFSFKPSPVSSTSVNPIPETRVAANTPAGVSLPSNPPRIERNAETPAKITSGNAYLSHSGKRKPPVTNETVIAIQSDPETGEQPLILNNTTTGFRGGTNTATSSRLLAVSMMNTLDAPLFHPALDTLIIVTPNEIIRINRENNTIQQFFSANLGVSPEETFYRSPDAYAKLNYWFNAGITYHISRFSIGTGIGLGYVFDEGKYNIHYKSKDSIGFYNSVVSYTIDPVTHQVIYQTEKKSVYDSVLHVADDRTNNRYTYLQIPLLFGYRIFETDRLSLTIQAGPAVSFLIESREALPVIDYSNARITRIENSTPSRMAINWQVWADLYLEYRITKTVSLYFEPLYKYYFKPVVEKENVIYSQPWSVGMNLGLQFNFGRKRQHP